MATINKRPSGKWQATVRSAGVSRSKTFTKRADAISWARQAELEAERGQLQQPERQTSTTTVADALARFARDVSARRSNASASVEKIKLQVLSRTAFAKKRLDELTAADVTAWRDKRLKQVQPSTVRREMTLLRSAVDHALADSGAQNVVSQAKRPVATGRRERRLQAGEWHALLGACAEGSCWRCAGNTLIFSVAPYSYHTPSRVIREPCLCHRSLCRRCPRFPTLTNECCRLLLTACV